MPVALLHPIQLIHCTSLANFQVKSEIGLLLRFPIDCRGYSNLAFIVVFTATLYFQCHLRYVLLHLFCTFITTRMPQPKGMNYMKEPLPFQLTECNNKLLFLLLFQFRFHILVEAINLSRRIVLFSMRSHRYNERNMKQLQE